MKNIDKRIGRRTILLISIIALVSNPLLDAIASNSSVWQESLVLSSQTIVKSDNSNKKKDDDDRGKSGKSFKMKETNCLLDDDCLKERKHTQDQIVSLRRTSNSTLNDISSFFRSNLTDAEKATVSATLSGLTTDLDNLDILYRNAIQSGTGLQTANNRAIELYNMYVIQLSPYVDPVHMDHLKESLQSLFLNRINIRQLQENRRLLKTEDEDNITRKINSIVPFQRIDFLLKVLSRIEKLENNISNSNMNEVRKARFLALLDEVRDIVQAKIERLMGWTDVFDVTPPVITALSVTGTTSGTTTLSATVNEPGVGYYVVLSSGSAMPTALQVKFWQTSTGQTASIKGSGATVIGMNHFAVSGLVPTTSYVIYFTAEDLHKNLQTVVWSVAFTTTAVVITDTTPPVISSLVVDIITSTGARLSVVANEAGTGHYVLLSSGSAMPSPTQIKLGQNASSSGVSLSGSSAISSGTTHIGLTSLIPNTAYVLYFVATDTSGNTTLSPMSVFLSTLADTTAPVISGLSFTGTTSTGTTLLVNVNESGTGHYVLLLSSGAVAPSASQVKLWQDGSGQTAPLKSSGATFVGTNVFPITGLTANTGYNLYFTAEDVYGNLQQTVQSGAVMTLP